jgi:DNA-binding NarL/FixJ family response regulator
MRRRARRLQLAGWLSRKANAPAPPSRYRRGVRILIVDDHPLFRRGLHSLLRDLHPELEISEAGDCAQALTMAGQPFDLVLLDLHMPDVKDLGALDTVRPAFESSRVVVLSGEEDPRLVRRAIDAHAAGFIPKSSTPEILLSALRLVLADGTYLPEVALKDLGGDGAGEAARHVNPDSLSATLSPKQMEVLRKAVEGKANKVIARELAISEGTVKAHLAAAFRALGVKNRTEAVYAAARSGLQLKA